MRISIVRLIAGRELRDLLRDRRTLFLILGLPVVLYPVFALVGIVFAASMLEQKVVIGVSGLEYLPQPRTGPQALVGGSVLLVEGELEYPPLIVDGKFPVDYMSALNQLGTIVIRPLESDDESAVQQRQCDAMLIVPPDLIQKIDKEERPALKIVGRESDDASKMAVKHLGNIVHRWNMKLKDVRFAKRGLPPHFDEPVEIVDPQENQTIGQKTATELRDTLVKFFPFLLVMWTMAGALHPAIDLTAGEKERGTMETLLISPAERGEIVAGKFFAVSFFSYMAAVWNVFWMGGGAVVLSTFLPFPFLSLGGLAWSILFAMPLAMMFSAIAIGLGVFARSTKEGQYYLLPLFLLVMPLTLWSMTPGMQLTPMLCLVPVTGLSLILQRLMAISGEPVPLLYWILVFGSLTCFMLLSLAWAARQFRRESVLFREAEHGGMGSMFRRWFRRKQTAKK
jgi:sodium transport system permease protein